MSEPVETWVSHLKVVDYGETVVMLSGQGVLTIPADHRQAVALALIGGVSDELVTLLVDAVWNNVTWDGELIREDAEADVCSTLNAVFGTKP